MPSVESPVTEQRFLQQECRAQNDICELFVYVVLIVIGGPVVLSC